MGTVVLLVMVTAAAPSDETSVRGQEALTRARAAQQNLDYEEALNELNVLVADPSATESERFEGHLLAGTIARIMEKDVEARGHFLYVVRADPTYRMPADTPPKVLSFFELIRLEAAPAPAAPSAEPAPVAAPEPAAAAAKPAAPVESESEAAEPVDDGFPIWPVVVGAGAAGALFVVGAAVVAVAVVYVALTSTVTAEDPPPVTLGKHDLSTALVAGAMVSAALSGAFSGGRE